MASYDASNIFGKILRGEIPSHKIFEDDQALVIMDAFPQARGHVLVIPKSPSRNLLDADPQVLAHIMPLLQRVGRAVVSATQADGLRLMQFNESAAGQTVFHLHFHLLPFYEGNATAGHASKPGDAAELAAMAHEIAQALANTRDAA